MARRTDGETADRGEPSLLAAARRQLGALFPAKARIGIARKLVGPLLLAIVPLFWVIDATQRSSLTTIGRDQGIFQYIAWATRLGDVDYRDIRDVNGPLIHLVHAIFLAFGGGEEHRFHVLELTVTGVSFALVGFLLPGIVARRTAWTERLAWAGAGWVVLSAQYQLYLYWNQAQRESFCDWFLLPSLALQIMRPRAKVHGLGGERARLMAIAALSTISWLGKPSFAAFTIMQLAVLVFDALLTGRRPRDASADGKTPDSKSGIQTIVPRRTLRRRWLDVPSPLGLRAQIGWFVVGGALGLLPPIAWLFLKGDPIAFAKVTLVDVPRVYRFIWAKSAQEILGEEGPLTTTAAGLAASALVVAFVVTRQLPRRTLALAGAPLAGLASVIAQHKGFGYHFHPITATTHMIGMLVVVVLWERFRAPGRGANLGRYVAIGLTAAYALTIASAMRTSPQTRNVWILAGGEDDEARSQREYFDSFKTYDFFPWELREGARYVATHTSTNARVQLYGMDPYLLFLADRRSATPYIYAYDLNADAALDGGWSNRPTFFEAQRIQATRAAHEADLVARLKAAPPEAFVFIDKSPLISYPDAWEDFRHCCSTAATWVASNYHAAKSFGEVHVWLRDDSPVPDAEGLP